MGRSACGFRKEVEELLVRLRELPLLHLLFQVLLNRLQGRRGLTELLLKLGRLARGGTLWCPCNFGTTGHPAVVSTIHDLAPFDVPQYFTPTYARVARALTRVTVRTSRVLVTPSAFTAERLVQLAKRRGAPDNVTALVARITTSDELSGRRASRMFRISRAARSHRRLALGVLVVTGIAFATWVAQTGSESAIEHQLTELVSFVTSR